MTRTAAQYAGDMRAIFERVDALYADRLAAKEAALTASEEVIANQREALAELRRRAEAAEAERAELRERLAQAAAARLTPTPGQESTEAGHAGATTLNAQRGAQGRWQRLRRRFGGA